MITLKCGCKVFVADQPDAPIDFDDEKQRKSIQFCDKHFKEIQEVVQANGGIQGEGQVGAGQMTIRALNAIEEFMERILKESMAPDMPPADA